MLHRSKLSFKCGAEDINKTNIFMNILNCSHVTVSTNLLFINILIGRLHKSSKNVNKYLLTYINVSTRSFICDKLQNLLCKQTKF